MRFDCRTFEGVIRDPDYLPYARHVAAKLLYSVGFSREKQLELLKVATADRDAAMRHIAMARAAEYEIQPEVVAIYVRGLSDPSMSVALVAAWALAEFFDMDLPRPGLPPEGIRLLGRQDAYYWSEKKRLDLVAKSVHAIRPDLISKKDLAAILSLQRYMDR